MHETATVRQDGLERLAAQAIANHRRFAHSYKDRRHLVTYANRTGLDQLVKASPEDLFAQHTLAEAQELIFRLADDVAQNGGVPQVERTEYGDAHLTGGTEASKHLQIIADRLRSYLDLGWQVHDRLLAERLLKSAPAEGSATLSRPTTLA
ncbi:hypothetical protein [Phycobacter azelaicus]|uniref:hypothetical protein n=1 Tax=Phycobacter azelaicus TaxID=2668075 RepID=UPI0018671A2A|nr:hypothetical protein [Phycobacter azelaicus]